MLEVLKIHWPIVSFLLTVVFSGLVWVIIRGERIETLSTRVTTLENKEACMSCKDCKENREVCQKHYEAELKHGALAFEEIKVQIRVSDEKSEARHKILIDHLINVAGRRHSDKHIG